ncbi:MAG: DNA cytosine methyltransferase [Dehalococcoidia bacterium]
MAVASAPLFAEFFAGIGLVRLALEHLGWRCGFANDIDPKKAEIYRQNFPANELVVDDVYTLTAADIPPGAALWTASFPCVDLSLAGRRRGIHGSHSSAYWGFAEVLDGAKPSTHAPAKRGMLGT